MFRKLLCLATAVLLLSMAATTWAAGWKIWDGQVSDEWNDPANWWDMTLDAACTVPPDWTDMVGIGHREGGNPLPVYMPVLRDTHWDAGTSSVLPGPDGFGYNAYAEIFAMSEWSGNPSQLTIDGGLLWQPANKYIIVGRHATDVSDVYMLSGGIVNTRYLRIGEDAGGDADFIMTGGYADIDSLLVGADDCVRGYMSVEDARVTVRDFFEPHFRVGSQGTMDIKDGGLLEILAANLDGGNPAFAAEAVGALNLHEGGVIEFNCATDITNTADLLAYFDYDDGGGGMIDGNVNAIAAGGGPGTFTFTQIGFRHWLVEVVPEPATIALLGLGGIALLRRKR